jgi:hypothetical protein
VKKTWATSGAALLKGMKPGAKWRSSSRC